MNSTFLFLIAIPLGVYLIILLYTTHEIGAEETRTQPAVDANVAAHDDTPERIDEHTAISETVARAPRVEVPEMAAAPVVENLDVGHEIAPTQVETVAGAEQKETPVALASEHTLTDSPAPAPASDLSQIETLAPNDSEPILPEGPVQLPEKGSPKYAFDYRGRLWIEKKRKSFFRQLRRPQLPPEEPK